MGSIPPIGGSGSSNFEYTPPPGPCQDAAQINKDIQNDLKTLIDGTSTPGAKILAAHDLSQQMNHLETLENQWPQMFSVAQKSTTDDLKVKIADMADPMNPPTLAQLQDALKTSERLHF